MLRVLKRLFGGWSNEPPSGQASLRMARAGQERAEEGLRQSEDQFRLMVESVKDYAIFMLDPQGRVATWNKGAQRIKGYTAEEIIGQHFSRFYPAEAVGRGWPEEELRRAAAEGRFEDEGWRVRKDGLQFWANVVITAVRDEAGALRGFAKVTRDLTDRMQAEENARRLLQEEAARKAAEEAAQQIERQREQLHVTLASIGDAVIVTDHNGVITFMNAVAAALTGWDEAAGQPLDQVFRIVNENTRLAVENPALRALREGVLVGLANHTVLIARDGRERPIDDCAAPIRIRHETVVGAVLVFRDISKRRQAEIALREENQRKTEFLALLAHELRNPLAPLRNGLQVMRLARDRPEAVEEARTVMERQLHHLTRLVDDLLDISRISRGKIELRKERISLAEVVSSAVEACEPLIQQHADELTVTLPDEPVYVDADKTRLAQALSNLLSNAVKYSTRGSRIWLTVTREPGEAVLRVKDTGVGIPAALLPYVFDMFTQVDRSLEKSHGGLGVGLAIVKRLIEMHGGSVEAHSEGAGKGSEFILRLPVALSPVQEQPAEGGEQPARLSAQHRILVVDDNVDAASSLAMMLQLMGQEVRTANDGLEAVDAASAFRPDLILLDIGMPKLNGYDACRRIREQPWAGDVAIVALTGWGQDEDKRRSQEAGFTRHLVKPVEPAALDKLLAELKSELRT